MFEFAPNKQSTERVDPGYENLGIKQFDFKRVEKGTSTQSLEGWP